MIETGEAIKESIETKTVVEAQTKQYQQQASDLEAQNKALQEQLALLQKQVQSLEEERDKLMPRIQEMTELAQQYQSLSEQVNSLKKAQKQRNNGTVANNTTKGKKSPLNNSGTPNKKEPCSARLFNR